MAQNYLPTELSFPKPTNSPAQGPGDTHAQPMAPKTTRPQPAGTKPGLACRQQALFSNTIPPPLPPPRGGNDRPTQAFPGPPSPQWVMKSSPARLPSRALGTTRLSPRHERRGATPLVTFAGTMAATPARSLSRALGASHQTPHSMLSTHRNPATSPPPPRPSVLPPRLVLNRSARRHRNRPATSL